MCTDAFLCKGMAQCQGMTPATHPATIDRAAPLGRLVQAALSVAKMLIVSCPFDIKCSSRYEHVIKTIIDTVQCILEVLHAQNFEGNIKIRNHVMQKLGAIYPSLTCVYRVLYERYRNHAFETQY